jgi:predicted membrane-bound spermidine synthase
LSPPRSSPTEPNAALVGAFFFLSGAAALVYQVAWQRILALHSGVGLYSVATIVAAFMAGLGLGSHLGGVLSARLSRRAALLAFAALEIGIGLFGAASTTIYYDWLYPRAVGIPSPSVAGAALHLVALLPPTLLMGMSLPFLVRACLSAVAAAGRTIGLLYTVNLFGAAAGAFAAPWLLIPRFGLRGAVAAAAAANALAGLGAYLLARGEPAGASAEAGTPAPRPAAPPAGAGGDEAPPGGRQPFALWLLLYALSGFVALSLEIVWFRLMDVAVKSTAFTFGTLLAVYLAGNGLGSLLGALRAHRVARPLPAFLACQCAILVLAGLSVACLAALPAEAPPLRGLMGYWRQYDGFLLGRELDLRAAALLYGLLPAALFLLPTVLMGVSFPILQRAVHDDARTSGRKVGALQAANILGCVAGSLAVGLLALGTLGTSGTLRALVAVGLVFALLGARLSGRRFLAAAAALALLAAALPGPDRLWRRLHGLGSEPAWIDEDATSVVVVAPEDGSRYRLSINGKGNSWLPFGGVHTVLGALPALVHPAPRDVAVIGLGSGDTAWAAACRPETERVTVFEIASPQPRVLARLARDVRLPDLAGFLADPRVHVVVADGRHALESEDRQYDVVEVDALRPQSAGSGNLYSVEFFAACARRLREGGVMCTWSPTPRVYAAFRRVFPHVLEADAGEVLLGSRSAIAVDREAWLTRLAAAGGYLGAANAGEVRARLLRIRPAFHEGRARVEPNRDLWPRDEFASPAGARPGPRSSP